MTTTFGSKCHWEIGVLLSLKFEFNLNIYFWNHSRFLFSRSRPKWNFRKLGFFRFCNQFYSMSILLKKILLYEIEMLQKFLLFQLRSFYYQYNYFLYWIFIFWRKNLIFYLLFLRDWILFFTRMYKRIIPNYT